MPDASFPLTIQFDQDNLSTTFNSVDEVANWLNHERQFWNPIGANQGQFATALQANVGLLNGINPSGSLENVQTVFASVSNRYRPSNGRLGILVKRIENPRQACLTFLMAQKAPIPPGTQIDQDLQSARTYVAIYTALGQDYPLFEEMDQRRQDIQRSLTEVQSIRAGDAAIIKRYESLISKTEEDWKNKIDGFEAKVALNAPKTYWSSRATDHSVKAVEARNQWTKALLAASVLAIAGVSLLLYFSSNDDPNIEIAHAIPRVILAGTVLAFVVWWLRQKLRDLRTHEHLAEDAAERVTMIETYAAMRGAGLQDSDLAPILAALYRPAVAGFVDDSGPVTPIEILMKTVGGIVTKKD